MEKDPKYSRSISAGTRVYYLDAHVDNGGDMYLSISEIPTLLSRKEKKRQRVFVRRENLHQFRNALNRVIKYIDKNG